MRTEDPADIGDPLATGSPDDENGDIVGAGADLDRCLGYAESREHRDRPTGIGRAGHDRDHVTDRVAGQWQRSCEGEGPRGAGVVSRVSHGRSPSSGPSWSEPITAACPVKPFGSVTGA
jgi:hypothetical protein